MTNQGGGFEAMGKEIMAVGSGQRIKCPMHYALIPGRSAWKIMPNPAFKNMDKGDLTRLRVPIRDLKGNIVKFQNLRTWIYQRDAQGQRIPDPTSFTQPFISATFAKETIYREGHEVCSRCKACVIK